MRRFVRTCALIAVMLAVTGAAAFAQYESDQSMKLSIFGGVYSPTGSTLREGTSIWKSFGVGYSLKSDAAGRPTLYASLDYKGASEGPFQGSCISITAMKLFYAKSGDEENTKGFYYGLGVSANQLSEKVDEQLYQIPPIPGEDNSGTKFGVTAVGGYDFGGFYAEVRYNQISELAPNADFSGLGFFVGTRSLY